MKASNQLVVSVSKGNKANGGTKQQGDHPTFYAEPGSSAISREQMIAEAAYFLAERHGFAPENTMADWLQAEADVTGMLAIRQ